MTSADRIPCLNPRCRRTAPSARHPDCTEIVCGKCWRLLPKAMRARYAALNRRNRRLDRLALKPRYGNRGPQWARLVGLMDAAQRRNWRAIRAFFLAPALPEGLETFLEEMGMS